MCFSYFKIKVSRSNLVKKGRTCPGLPYTLWLIGLLDLLKQTTYPDDKNILFYYLSMSSLQNKTKNCLRDKFIFSHLQNPIVHIS